MKNIYFIFLLIVLTGCNYTESSPGRGVSKELAEKRFENISSIRYKLHFDIPDDVNSKIEANVEISFALDKRDVIYLDFFHDSINPVYSLIINDVNVKPVILDEHLVIEKGHLKKGTNHLSIKFLAGEQSLNRRDEFLYTLLVPDRARTLFPCFDQPDLKAIYELSLTLPNGWIAMANSNSVEVKSGYMKFAPSEPLPTYLFSFVAGKFKQHRASSADRIITIFHRETEPYRISQCDTIAAQIFSSLEWLEDYTGIPYPFSKYDIAIIPGFQYGGMEHAGATLYADRTLFTGENPTSAERFARAKLIAHETAHMWFGDYVTMKWFDDVWTKEVFANWFAARMVTPLFPEMDHNLAFTDSYFPPAYEEDRTLGANPVQQPLDNLNNAGLVYGNIIYNKAPIVMEMMVEVIGEENFRKGIREYLEKFAFSNATWDNLIEILDSYTEVDLNTWSNVWIKERGRPEVKISMAENGGVKLAQKDPFNRGLEWEQEMLNIVSEDGFIYPNVDGKAYALFITDSLNNDILLERLPHFTPLTRGSLLITLYENMVAGYINPEGFSDAVCDMLLLENDRIVFNRAVSYLASANIRYLQGTSASQRAADALWRISSSTKTGDLRLTAFRSLVRFAWGEEWALLFFDILKNPSKYTGIKLSERDFINLAYESALRNPLLYDEIKRLALTYINGKDRREEFSFIYPALSPDKAVRDSLFRTLLEKENRVVEPWTASALTYLCHYSRSKDAVNYITPALAILPEIQRTGDIFFPRNWLQALLSGQRGDRASLLIIDYLDSAKIHPLLRGKVLQQADHIINPKARR
ncbi:MAG: M1 family aminopeptidase [Bacteroidales bacterium]|nr:M1 family aminopeptidase [Bacteroidales bacterium]